MLKDIVVKPRVIRSLAVAASLVVLAGCGSSSSSSSATAGSSGNANKSSSTGQSIGQLAQLATRDGNYDGHALKVTLNEVRRDGTLVVINYTATNPATTGDKINIAYAFTSRTGTLGEHDGVTVIDNQNRKRYPVAHDSNKTCLCSAWKLGSPTELEPGGSKTFEAVTGAPPADVKTVDVDIADVGVFSGVTLS